MNLNNIPTDQQEPLSAELAANNLDSLLQENGSFLTLVEHAPFAVSVSDPQGNILYANPKFCKLTGYSKQELIGQNHSLLSYRTTPKSVYQDLWQRLATEGSWTGKLVNKQKNGQRYLADVSISALYADKEHGIKATHYMAIQHDISDKHLLHTQLHNQNIMMKAVLNAAPVAIVLLDPKHNVIMDNLAYKTLNADLGQESSDRFLHELQIQLGDDAIKKLRRSSYSEGYNVAIEVNKKQGKRWFSCRVSPLDITNADVDAYFTPVLNNHFILTISEYTQQKNLQEHQRLQEIKAMTTEAEMAHAMHETLHAAIHQFQEPVNLLEAALGLLLNQLGPCNSVTAMQRACDAGNSALVQLEEALSKRPAEVVVPVNINQLVHDVSALASPRLLERSISLQLSLNAVLPAIIGQSSRLRVALKQLLDNAMDAIDYNKVEQRKLCITTTLDTDSLLISVEDSGPGIDKQHYLQVFKPFYTTKPAAAGGYRGIGLSIVQQVINEHSGSIDITNSELGGSKVSVRLPIKK